MIKTLLVKMVLYIICYYFAKSIYQFSDQYMEIKFEPLNLLTSVYKRVCKIFYFVQILSYLQKFKRLNFYTLVFYIFINNSRSRQNKKNLEHPFVDIIKLKMCAKFQQKTLNSGSWSSSKFSIFQTKNLVSWV